MKKYLSRLFCGLLSLVLLLGLCAGGTRGLAEEALSGKCGQNLTWRFVPETGTLTVEGTGAVWDYDNAGLTPWAAYADSIQKIVLSSGVTAVGKNAFSGCAVEEVTFPETLEIGRAHV